MQDAVKRFAESKDSGLCLIDMPTGIGKTYLTCQLIKRFIQKEILQDFENIIYITPLKKNAVDVFSENLFSEFKGKDEELFYNTVLMLLPNYETVVEKFSDKDFLATIPENIRIKQSYKDLKIQVEDYNRLYELGNYAKDLYTHALKEIRVKFEVAFRHDLEFELDRITKKDKKKKKQIVFSDEYKWLRELYPSCYSSSRKVLIMTADKFLSVNDPIIDKPYTFLSHLSEKKTLVFIDEFDATKDVVLNREIERCVDYKIDIFKLFSGIITTLKGVEFPEQLFGNSDVSRKAFMDMKKRMLSTEEKHNLNFLCKLDEDIEVDKHYLFDDFQIHTISATDDNKIVTIKNSIDRNQNIIRFEEKGKIVEDSFASTIYSIKNAINFFIRCCSIMAANFKNEQNRIANINGSELIDKEQAISSIISYYNLDRNVEEILKEMVGNDLSLPKKERTKNLFDTDFYMNGFRYYDFSDDLSHSGYTSIMMGFLKNTPERFLVSLADVACVVGLSATGSIDTVTGNYNLGYVKKKLGNKYYELPEEDKNNIKRYVEENLPNHYPINVHKLKLDEHNPLYFSRLLFNDESNIEYYEGLFGKYVDLDNKSDPYFGVGRTAKAMLAVRQYLENKKAKVILVITNRNVKEKGDNESYCQEIIEDIVKRMAEELDIEIPSIHYLFGNDFEKERTKYLKEVRNHKRVILFSSYPAAGTGQNLQYEEENEEDKIIKNDIDSLYIENPTNIIVKKTDLKNDEGSLIKYIYQMETMRRSGDLGRIVVKENIKKAFKQYMNPEKDIYFGRMGFLPYSTDSANNNAAKILIQAVGRICRTRKDNFKGEVNIYVDSVIFDKVRFGFLEDQNRLLNPEFKKIIELSDKKEKFDPDFLRALKRADELNDRVSTKISATLSENKNVWSARSMQSWTLIRKAVLQYPTISREKLNELIQTPGLEDLEDFYLFHIEGRKIKAYSYNPDSEEKQFWFGKNDEPGYIYIDEVGARLNFVNENHLLRTKFYEKGYPTIFLPNEGIILPVVYQNIYKGALGEEVGRIIIESLGYELSEIEDEHAFEKFDYCFKANKNVYIDFKNWANDDSEQKRHKMMNISDKLRLVNGKKAFLINIFGEETTPSESDGIVKVPSLFKFKKGRYFDLGLFDKLKLKRYIEEAIKNGNKQ